MVVHARDGYRCRYCGTSTSYKAKNKPYSRTVDHVIPKSKGGRTNVINLVSCCKSCNDAKKSFSLAELGWSLRPIPRFSPGQVDEWIRQRWPHRCVNCDKPPYRHTLQPYHGGPRECLVGGTLYMATSHFNHLRSLDILHESV